MAGSVTFLHGRHASQRAGGWVRELVIPPRAWRAIDNALGRRLTMPERERVADALALHAHALGDAEALFVSAQSQKRTLAALAALPDAELPRAFAHCDERTNLRLVNELHRAGGRTADELTRPTPEALRAAVAAALARWQPAKGGRPGRYRWRAFALCVCRLWRELARSASAPPGKFAASLFDAAGAELKSAQRAEAIAAAGRDLRALPRALGRPPRNAAAIAPRGTVYRMGKVYRKF